MSTKICIARICGEARSKTSTSVWAIRATPVPVEVTAVALLRVKSEVSGNWLEPPLGAAGTAMSTHLLSTPEFLTTTNGLRRLCKS